LLTLELDASDIKFITNVGKGDIDFIDVKSFEANSNDGSLLMQITNTGSL
jgi:hypothetical protein